MVEAAHDKRVTNLLTNNLKLHLLHYKNDNVILVDKNLEREENNL